MQPYTTAEVATQLRCSAWKVRSEAKRLGIGYDLGGRAGFRFTQADVDAIRAAGRLMSQPAPRRRRRRAS